ncbi:MAG: DUF488 family protein [Alphaproteobacteria bacterium]
MAIRLKRVYLEPELGDGRRVLVDRLWPRGLRKDAARIDLWARDLAPSDSLRAWYGKDPERWPEFRRRYFAELDGKRDAVRDFAASLGKGTVTFLFAKADETRNNAVALKMYLERKGRGGTVKSRPSMKRATGRPRAGASPAHPPRRARRRGPR